MLDLERKGYLETKGNGVECSKELMVLYSQRKTKSGELEALQEVLYI